mmetsp:Transcript_1485/g.1834  ORF Transcript_1485/g.1834 Transcript_1485/m.1834 type:complete len:774 (+) Transcript_1485:118-2439(+)
MSKRPGTSLAAYADQQKKSKLNTSASSSQQRKPQSLFLSRPVNPEDAIRIFLTQARTQARAKASSSSSLTLPLTKPFFEIEARLGILRSSFGLHPQRVLPSGPKRITKGANTYTIHAFDCTNPGDATVGGGGGGARTHHCNFESGVTRTHYINYTDDSNLIAQAFGVRDIRRDIEEIDMKETVYSGYKQHYRVCYPNQHQQNQKCQTKGTMEQKGKLTTMDVAFPAAPYDLRINLATEDVVDSNVSPTPPDGWTQKRFKRRKRYRRKDASFAWYLDITEVSTASSLAHTTASATSAADHGTQVQYEIEFELDPKTTIKLINELDDSKVKNLITSLSKQLYWMMGNINPITDILSVEDSLIDHTNHKAVTLALAQCGALRQYMMNTSSGFNSPIADFGASPTPSPKLSNIKFPGCMPVNFQRHNIEQVQQCSNDADQYFVSEKTDGVRHFMVFTGDAVVLVDRAMKGKQIQTKSTSSSEDPMSFILPLIKQGTVLDGEVVMRRGKPTQRPVFIVFDVLTLGTKPILHLPFSQRLKHLKHASFRTETANRDIFADENVMNPNISLPLVRKIFCQRMELDSLMDKINEEKGLRMYKNGVHDHLTDGIIFQPNLPYVCGTDVNLMKWKYLDTVTIDVQIMPAPLHHHHHHVNNDDDILHVGVLGEEGTMVDMTRFIRLPNSERRRLEADRADSGAKIAEVGFEPTTGEWYYLTMRPDKIAPNHISTVLGTLLELAESLSTEELRYRMSVRANERDSYRKEIKKMQKQLLDFQRKSRR